MYDPFEGHPDVIAAEDFSDCKQDKRVVLEFDAASFRCLRLQSSTGLKAKKGEGKFVLNFNYVFPETPTGLFDDIPGEVRAELERKVEANEGETDGSGGSDKK